ncbi:MAG: serine--tRNA ligase [Patescibacteria group bacterium]
MLDIKWVREHQDEVKASLKKRGSDFDMAALLSADEKRRAMIKEGDDLRARHNELSESIASAVGDERQEKIIQSKELKKHLGVLEASAQQAGEEFAALLHQLPNMTDPEAPDGASEKDNKVLREVGERPQFDFELRDHLAIGTALDIFDFERGAKVAGSGFYYLKNEGVLLELALVRFAIDFLRGRGFTPVLTPDLAYKKFYLGTGYLPRGPEAQTYEIADSDLGLIATAEITLAGLHAGEILDVVSLPLRYAGYSHCFRREDGAYGKYSKGLYRVHQFSKVEMFAFATPETSKEIHMQFLDLEEQMWQMLGIPYRVLDMCAGDLGAQAVRKFDLEAWMPGRDDWGEVTSTSNTTDYQARNLDIRYRTPDGSIAVAHTINGTALATSRAPIAVLENYQQADGSVAIPEVLQKYMGGMEKIDAKRK